MAISTKQYVGNSMEMVGSSMVTMDSQVVEDMESPLCTGDLHSKGSGVWAVSSSLLHLDIKQQQLRLRPRPNPRHHRIRPALGRTQHQLLDNVLPIAINGTVCTYITP